MGRKRARKRDSDSPDEARPLRRSARLAGFAAREAEREIRARQLSPPATRWVSERPSLKMQLVLQPPEKIVAGAKLEHALIVTFTANEADSGAHPNSDGISEITNVWAFLSLMTEDGSQMLTPPDETLLRGQRTDSVHPVLQPQQGSVQTIAYARFSNLVISEPGKYCFRVNIIDMSDTILGQSSDGGRVLPPLHSEVFEVVDDGGADLAYAEKHAKIIDQLKEIGISV